MRFVSFDKSGKKGLALKTADGLRGELLEAPGMVSLRGLLGGGADAITAMAKRLKSAPHLDETSIAYRPPIDDAGKIVCVGLNYRDHSSESGFEQPDYPTLFARFNSSLIGHNEPMIRPLCSEQLDYEGELVAVVGKAGKDIPERRALEYVAGYSIFNDGSIRDYQFKAPQWTPGKNFDGTGAFGPAFITADELPLGCATLRLLTRLNGHIVQSASVDDMVFSVASLVSLISRITTLQPGDLIVTGTPSGVGLAQKPPLFMKAGDVCEVEIEGLGTLVNSVVDEIAQSAEEAA